ncbi:MAG: molybdopterin oxidoreductase family protein [Actinomycetes bacterium]
MRTIEYRTCPLCEATCGLELHMEGEEIALVRGDKDDVFSKGYLCPKGAALKDLVADPDRLRAPLVRRGDEFVEVTWDEAFAAVREGLMGVIERHGRDAVGAYLGNPCAHNLAPIIYNRALLQGLGTTNVFSASTVDQMPKHVSAGLMFGTPISVPIPDLDRTDHLLMLGANPFASNGSLMTAPDLPGRLRAIRARGGRIVVVDPRRSKTAEEADEWVAIRPGTDAHLLFGLVNVILASGRADLGRAAGITDGMEEIERLAPHFTPEAVAPVCGVPAADIRRMATELLDAPTAAVYGRIGTCTQEYGTLASWLVDVVNVLTGNLDRPGGALFPKNAAGSANTGGTPGRGRGFRIGRRHSRVEGKPEVLGEFPVATLASEILTPGAGQIRALVTVAGNPVVSTPDAGRLDAALGDLEFMVCVDIYRNETTRHADVILPPGGILTKEHFDLAFYSLSIRNVANYSPPINELPPGEMHEWEILLRLAAIAGGAQGSAEECSGLDDFIISGLVTKAAQRDDLPSAEEMLEALALRRGPARVVDFMLRTGPYGDRFGAEPDGLSLAVLEANPHGVDLGPLQPRLPEVLRTPTGRIDLAPALMVADVEARLVPSLGAPIPGLVLVGRRDLRSNNSWMHNIKVLVKGKARCTLHIHPDDAADLGLTDGAPARVRSRVGEVVIPVEVTDGIRPGVVSIPHGWGHGVPGTDMRVAAEYAGVNSNLLTDASVIDPLSGNAVLNGIPVEVAVA